MEEAWLEAQDSDALRANPEATHAGMVLRIVQAANQGERDMEVLKKLALEVARAAPREPSQS